MGGTSDTAVGTGGALGTDGPPGERSRAGEPDVAGTDVSFALVSHELRAPLSIVQGAADVAVRQDLDAEQLQKLLVVIRRNAEIAIHLAERLALAPVVEADEVGLEIVVTDVVAIVHETIDDLRTAYLGDHHLQVRGNLVSEVEADEMALRQILVNLLLNASKYSPDDADIEVTATGDDGQLELIVGDHGAGVPADEREHIFEKYGQVDGRSSGMGLGLFVARGLARAHHGELSFRPSAAGGSEFVLTLPRRQPTTPAVSPGAASTSGTVPSEGGPV